MVQWYAQVAGQRYGPVTEEEMRQWIAQGRVKATDSVWSEGMANWVPATSVFPAIPPLAAPVVMAAALPNAPCAVTSMVCGIIGVAVPCAGLVLGIVALMQSRKAKAAIAASPGRYGGDGMATAGMVLGIIATVVGGFWALYFIFIMGIIGAAFSTGFHHGFPGG